MGQAMENVRTFEQPDGYLTHYRLWGPAEAADVVVMVHGGISHSGWQAPLGQRLGRLPGTAFIAVDLRGSGLNDVRGHIPSGERAIADLTGFLRHVRRSYDRVHLAGWCFGAQVTTVAAARLADADVISSMIMVCPGFVFRDWYNEVLDRSVDAALAAVEELKVTPDPARPFVLVPLRAADFTDRPEWREYIEADALKLVHVTSGTIDAWEEIAVRSEKDFDRIGRFPVLAVIGDRDRLVDGDRVQDFLRGHPDLRVHVLDTGHAINFEDPDAFVALVADFIGRRGGSPAAAARLTP